MKILIGLLLVACSPMLHAAIYDDPYFSYITKQNGLSDHNVNCILKDSDGFMWFGTRNGLCRFDGYEMKIYQRNDNYNSLSGNRILDIAEDYNGNLWIGTYKDGLNRFNKQTETFEHFGLAQNIGQRINRIRIMSDSSIWIASNIGVVRLRPIADSISIVAYKTESGFQSTSDILETKTKEIYIATEDLVIQKLNTATQKFEEIVYKRKPELSSNYQKRIIEDRNGVIWIIASYHGLCSYDPKTGQSEIYTAETNNLSTNVLIGSMNIDPDGNIWICTEENGINIFNIETKTYQHIKKNPEQLGSLNSDQTYCVYFDDEKRIWIGTFDKGINVFNPYQTKFKSSLFASNDLKILLGNSVLDIFEDSKRRVWIGTDVNGLFCFEEGKKPRHIKKDDASNILTTNTITALGEDPLGNLLIGTYTGGMISYNPENNKVVKFHPDFSTSNLSSPHVWEIITDSKKRVWLGLLALGVDNYLYNEKAFINYGPYSNQPNKIDFYNVMVIEEDNEGDIWFGTEGKGVFILDAQTNRVLRIESDSISNFSTEGVIKCLAQDKWGNMWIGTEDNGLIKYERRNGAFTKFYNRNGFTSSQAQSLKDDHLGNLWIGTTSGLFQYNTTTNNFRQFIIEDGLSSNDFNPDAMFKLHDGRIIAGTNNGADIIDSDVIEINQNLPRVVLTKLTVMNNMVNPEKEVNNRVIIHKSITHLSELTLTWREKIFTLEFAALNYTLPQKCEYKYMLEGFDEDWISTSATRRIASYSNLRPGTYIFKVKASNNDGKWGENERTIKIMIKPPFYNTIVFKLLLFIFIAILIFTFYKNRIKSHNERFRNQQIEQEKKIMALENEKLESELKILALNIINKNKLLIEQKNRLLNLSNKSRLDVKESLEKVIESIDADLDEEKDWECIEPQIDRTYNQFITNLKAAHPDLTASEIRIAAYIRMNLSTKEIGEFMNKTQRAVENDRYRLRKKIGLDSNDNIQNYLMNL